MSEVGFVLKSLIITVALIFVMQINVGHRTVQKHALGWMRSSMIVDGLRSVAEGAVVVGGKTKVFAASLIGSGEKNHEEKTENASRGYSWEVKRSEAYYKQKRREESEKKSRESSLVDGDEMD